MRKVLVPILWILAGIAVLTIAAYLYEIKYGSEGPFESEHHH